MELKDFTEKEQEQIKQAFLSLSEGMRRQRRLNVWLCAILNSMPWPSAKETYLKKNGKNCVSS